ncbi:hypothetical protein [Acaryochloris thomasi]|uniref:hypothetical protein n=1 Tax=Acaryochloris thomasi TaxID=2929456 RepID=UPI0013146450|nr:hypothetical protein [Acaryochloris thomasi]
MTKLHHPQPTLSDLALRQYSEPVSRVFDNIVSELHELHVDSSEVPTLPII